MEASECLAPADGRAADQARTRAGGLPWEHLGTHSRAPPSGRAPLLPVSGRLVGSSSAGRA